MSVELWVILSGIGAVVLLWLLLRFGRQIARAVIVVGILAVGVIVALALLAQASASRQAAQAATIAATGQAATSLVLAMGIGALAVVAVGGLGGAGVFWVRWKLAEQRRERIASRQRRVLPEPAPDPPASYVVEDEDIVDLADVDLARWGW